MRAHLATLVEDFVRHGRQTAVVTHLGNRRLVTSWGDLGVLSARFAAGLEARCIRQGDRVLLWGGNRAEWIAAFFGCVLRGVIVVPLDAAGDLGFAARVCRETTPLLLVGEEVRLQQLQSAGLHIPTFSFGSFAETLPPPDEKPVAGLNRETPLQIIFTSGTTAEPKGIVHTHGNVLASLDPIESEIDRYRGYERLVHPLRFLHTLPLSHVFGQFMGLWVPPLLAAQVHFEARLEAPRLLRLTHEERISVIAAVPRVLELLRTYLLQLDPQLVQRVSAAKHKPALRRWWRFRKQHRLLGWKFWAFVCGGASLPEDLEQFWTGLGFALIQGYGMTETTALVTLNHPFRGTRGSIGKPLAGREVRIAPDGEILVRGVPIASKEWRAGQMQSRAGENGWLATGDLAAARDDGALVFAGRKSDTIVTAAGLNIHPQDLEAALQRTPAVRAAVVVPYESANGPQPVAVLILQPPATAKETAAADALAQANAQLASYQQMRRWLLWPQADFPRTTTGKVLRREVAAWAGRALAGGEAISAPEHDPLLQALRSLPGIASTGALKDDCRLSEDLHLDSLGLVELQTTLESRFGVELDESAFQQVRTVGDLRPLVNAPTAPFGRLPVLSGTGAGLSATTANPRADYPRWPWWTPVRWIRSGFLQAVAVPLVRLLLAPRVVREASSAEILDRPMLIVSNHVTAFDVPLVLYALPWRARVRVAVAMAAHLLLGWKHGRAEKHRLLSLLTPFAYWILSALFNLFPLPQGIGVRASFTHAGEALDRGMHVLLFPEGRRSADGTLGTFQSGIGLLTEQSGTPVLPVYLEGLGAIKQGRRRWFRPGSVTIHIGTPVRMQCSETAQTFTERLRAIVASLGRG